MTKGMVKIDIIAVHAIMFHNIFCIMFHMAMEYEFSALVNTLLCQNLLYFKILLIGSHLNLISTLPLISAMTPKWSEL